jgi:hypothetical protein
MAGWRTAGRGGQRQACPDGHGERIWDHAWRQRMGRPGAWVPSERWRAKPPGCLGAGAHDHGLGTRPHALQARWWATVEVRRGRLWARGHDTRVERRGDRPSVGATPGSLATRQTWRQSLILHPQRHGLVRGGGRRETGHGGVVQPGVLWPMRVVRALVRGPLWAASRRAWGTRPQPASAGGLAPTWLGLYTVYPAAGERL